MSFPRARYIWYIFPFIYLIILSINKTRLVGYGFILLVFLQSLNHFFNGFSRGPESKFWLYVYEENISLPENALLSSHNRRHPYFFLDTRNYLGDESWEIISKKISAPSKFMPELTIDLIIDNNLLFVMGDSTYIDSTFSQVNEMAASSGYRVERTLVTPDLNEFEGWGLVELTIKEGFDSLPQKLN
jgi:hypothetical protein